MNVVGKDENGNALSQVVIEVKASIKGDKGDPPKHEWNGTDIRFENSNGSWGNWINVRGADFKFTDFTTEQLDSLKLRFDHLTELEKDSLKLKFNQLTQAEKDSIKGDKGDPFIFSDFTAEQLNLLKLHFSDLTDQEKDSLKLHFNELTQAEKDSLKLQFNHLTEAEKDSLKLHFNELTQAEKDSLKLKWEHLTDQEKDSLKLHFNELTTEEKDSLKLKWEHLTTEEKDSLKLHFDELTEAEKESLKPDRLVELETITGNTTFDSSKKSEELTLVDNNTTTSVALVITNDLPIGWMRGFQAINPDDGGYNFVESTGVQILTRLGVTKQVKGMLHYASLTKIADGVYLLDGDLIPE